MANETPNHDYRIVSDNPKEGEDYVTSQCLSGCVVIIAVIPLVILIWSLIFEWTTMSWFSTIALCVLLIVALSLWFNYDKTSPRLRKAERAKLFLGFDFGDVFTLNAIELWEHWEILLTFDEISFVPLLEFCKSKENHYERIDNNDDIIITEIIVGQSTFFKIENHYSPSLSTTNNLWCTFYHSCEIDYENRTLKMTTVNF